MDIEVVVPWRPGCPHRERAWRWVRGRYAEMHPTWKITEALAPIGDWCKGAAVNPAVARSSADIIVQADADVWTNGLNEAIAQVEAGASWAVPHNLVHRLDEAGTEAVLAGGDWHDQPLAQPSYAGFLGGGVTVASREVISSIPVDVRFSGWG